MSGTCEGRERSPAPPSRGGRIASYTGTISGLEVAERIDGAHSIHVDYPLLPGDLLLERKDGTFGKFGPGLGIEGFVLTEEQRATLKPVEDVPFGMGGLDYLLGADE